MPQIKSNKSIIDKLFLFGGFIFLISAINNPVADTNFTSFKSIITFLRWLAPFILLPTFLIYLIFIDKNLKIDWIYLFYLIYIFGLFIGLIIKKNLATSE